MQSAITGGIARQLQIVQQDLHLLIY
jgi:hypothetical protein